MRTAFEELLVDSLRDRAEAGRPVDPAPLLHDARMQGRRIRTRRRLVTAIVAAGAVTAVVVTGSVVGRPDAARPPAATPSHSPARSTAVVVPRAVGTPGAATDPGLVGTDPWVVHLSVDALASSTFSGMWRSTPTYEMAGGFWRDATVYVSIARDPHALPSLANGIVKPTMSAPAAVTVAGRPGTMVKAIRPYAPNADYTLQWQPVPGLWARLQSDGSTLAEALQAAAAVRFDQATRCAQPFAVGAVPAGLKVRYCQVALNDPAPVPRGGNVKPSTGATYGGSELDFGGATGRGLQLKVLPRLPGRLAGATRNLGGLMFSLTSTGAHKYTQQELTDVLNSIRLVGDLTDPSTYR